MAKKKDQCLVTVTIDKKNGGCITRPGCPREVNGVCSASGLSLENVRRGMELIPMLAPDARSFAPQAQAEIKAACKSRRGIK